MESPVANLTVGPFSKDPRKIPDLLNKYLETAAQNQVGPITNSVRTYKVTFTVQFSFVCIQNYKYEAWDTSMDDTTRIERAKQNDKNILYLFPDRTLYFIVTIDDK